MNAQPAATFHLRLNGPGIEVDKEVGQDAALAILGIALGGSVGTIRDVAPAQRAPRLSLREFIDLRGLRSNPEKIAVFAAYLRDHNGQEDASRDDIKACFKSAGEPMPGNFSRDLAGAVQAGLIAEDPRKPGRYYLTRKGDELAGRGGE